MALHKQTLELADGQVVLRTTIGSESDRVTIVSIEHPVGEVMIEMSASDCLDAAMTLMEASRLLIVNAIDD